MPKAKAKSPKAKMPTEPSEGQQSSSSKDISNKNSQTHYKVGDIVQPCYGKGQFGQHFLLLEHMRTINSNIDICVESWYVLNIDEAENDTYGFMPRYDMVVA